MKKNKKSYEIDQCGLYAINGIGQLEKLIGLKISKMQDLISDENYLVWMDKKSGKKPREIQEPKPKSTLLYVHNRIAFLLSGIKVPDYLYSGIRGRSYIKNAMEHVNNNPLLTLDIAEFYKSVSKKSVYWFFRNRLKMAKDIAGLLSEICTYQDHIPTGSRLSMPLAYFASSSMFDRLYDISCNEKIIMTVYVDDITFSGANVNKKFKELIINEINYSQFEVKLSKTKLFKKNSAKIVTGVIINKKSIHIRNRQHKIISDLRNGSDQKKLISHLYAAGQIEPGFKQIAQKVRGEM